MTPVDEVLLRRQALPQRRDPPLRDEGVRCHGVYASTTSLSALGELGLVLTTGSRELDGSASGYVAAVVVFAGYSSMLARDRPAAWS